MNINKIVITPVVDWSAENHIVMKEGADKATTQQLYQEVSACNIGLWRDKVLSVVNKLVEQVDYYTSVTKSIVEMENKILLTDVTIDELLVLYDQVSEIKNDALRLSLSNRLDNVYNQVVGEVDSEKSESTESLE